MRLKTINNNKGSALLWCILLIIILTILIGALTASAYAYFNYTMYSVKRQQAYFTARSAMSTILEKVSESSNDEGDPDILPSGNAVTEFTDFGFPSSMGSAKAWIARGKVKDPRTDKDNSVDGKDYATILVQATYADETYNLKATIANQPVYFAGLAVKDLNIKNGSLSLTKNTDLYYNNTDVFNLSKYNGKLKVYGNLVTKGDAVITEGTEVAYHKINKTISFRKTMNGDKPNYSYSKKIWNPSEYIISNKTLKYFEDTSNFEYESSTLNTLKRLTDLNTDYIWCNNYSGTKNYFGGESSSASFAPKGAVKNLFTDAHLSGISYTDKTRDALETTYIKVMSATGIFGSLASNYMDIAYIGYSATTQNSASDAGVVPVTYLLIPDASKSLFGGGSNPLTVRILFGNEYGKLTWLGSTYDKVKSSADSLISTIFNYQNKPAYTIVYLGANETLELGMDDDIKVGSRLGDIINYFIPFTKGKTLKETYVNAKTDGSLVFPYSIYGEAGSKLILHDGVTILGEVNVPSVEIDGDVTITYCNSNGSQVGKQKVDSIWSIVQYDD